MAEQEEYSLEDRLKQQLGEYCDENMSQTLKDSLIKRISNDNKIYVCELSYDEKREEEKRPLYSKDSSEHIGRNKILEDLVRDFRNSNSVVGKDLDSLLKHCNLKFRIIDDSKLWNGPGGIGTPNGMGRFHRREDGKLDKTTIYFNASTFNKDHIDKLPGLLAHELAHVLDFNRRPQGYHGMIDGQETFADITGQMMAEKAGYRSLPIYKYMGDHVRKEQAEGKSGEVEGSPMGDFREATINLYERENNPSYSKDIKNLGSYKVFSKLEDLRNRLAKSNAPAPMRDNPKYRDNFVNNAKQGSVLYDARNRDSR